MRKVKIKKIAANAISYAVKEIVKNIELNDMVKFVPNEKRECCSSRR